MTSAQCPSLWWMVLMSPIVLVFVGLGIHYLVLGRFPILVLDHIGVTYRAYEDPVTLLRRGPVVWLRWDEITRIGTERSRSGRFLTIRSNRTRQRPRWLRALGVSECGPYIRISLSVPVSEARLVYELRSRARPHTFTDERTA